MRYDIEFKGLPFTPTRNQVIYIEDSYCKKVNDFIRSHYGDCQRKCEWCGLEFVYIPLLTSSSEVAEKVRYYAPYLTEDITEQDLPKSNMLSEYLYKRNGKDNVVPSIIIYGYSTRGIKTFHAWSFPTDDDADLWSWFSHAISEIDIAYQSGELTINPDAVPNVKRSGIAPDTCCSMQSKHDSRIPKMPEIEHIGMAAEEEPDSLTNSVEQDIKDLKKMVKRLQMKGLTLTTIQELVASQEKLSRMIITPDYRIILPDYKDMHIHMRTTAMALYLLFLRYEEGIRLKELPDHFKELLDIYRQLKPVGTDEESMIITVTKMVNPCGNTANENLSYIRSAFVKQFDEHLAKNYIVTGEKGENYRIILDRSLIEYQEPED